MEYRFACADPAHVLDHLRGRYQLRTDGQLARALGVHAPMLSKIRSGKLDFGAALVLRIHEEFGLPMKELRAMFGQASVAQVQGHRCPPDGEHGAARAGAQSARLSR